MALISATYFIHHIQTISFLRGRGYNGFLASIVIEKKDDAGMLMIRKGSRNAAFAVLVKRTKAILTSGDGWEAVHPK